MKTIAVLAFDDVIAFDLSLACDTFDCARDDRGALLYRVVVCSEKRSVRIKHFSLATSHSLESALKADTIIVPGGSPEVLGASPMMRKVLRRAYAKGIRIASICSGAFVLAECGLLDGKRATTHWAACAELQSRFALVEVDSNALYIDNGQILTSAGAASGLDLCLYMIRKDFGATVAARTARLTVVPLERSGGQSQFVEHEIPSSEGSLDQVIRWMEANYRKPIGIADLAKQIRMSERTLLRKFQTQLGQSPMQLLIAIRVKKAQEILETKSLAIEEIAERVGFGTTLGFRTHFKRRVGVSPKDYRQAFQAKAR